MFFLLTFQLTLVHWVQKAEPFADRQLPAGIMTQQHERAKLTRLMAVMETQITCNYLFEVFQKYNFQRNTTRLQRLLPSGELPRRWRSLEGAKWCCTCLYHQSTMPKHSLLHSGKFKTHKTLHNILTSVFSRNFQVTTWTGTLYQTKPLCCPSKNFVCSQPRDVGVRCSSTPITRYYFNADTKSCSDFAYNGCEGKL